MSLYSARVTQFLSSRCPRCACRQLSVVCAFSEVIVVWCCGLRWEECVQSVMRIVQSLAEQPVVKLFQQLVKVWQIRRTVAAALAASQKRVDSLDIDRGYEASPRGRRVRQPGHHDCSEDLNRSCHGDAWHAERTATAHCRWQHGGCSQTPTSCCWRW